MILSLKAVLKKCCDQINNAKTAFALESISCADLNLESVTDVKINHIY